MSEDIQQSLNRPLLVIGGGPKAAAIAAKASILRKFGEKSPPVWVVENQTLAANWNGKHGFTSGKQRLGTPPEKDIGFPYMVDREPAITTALHAQFSWPSYVILRKPGHYGEWIDRGRPHPSHKEWGQYLEWVIKKTADRILLGWPKRVEQEGDHWKVCIRMGAQEEEFEACGIVITGPGDPKIPAFSVPSSKRIVYGHEYWKRDDIRKMVIGGDDSHPIAIIGGGETAASIVSNLIETFADDEVKIVMLTRTGTIFTRGESYYENRAYTEYSTWPSLPPKTREDVIRRTDRGVFSMDVARQLAYTRNTEHRFFEVHDVAISLADQDVVMLNKGHPPSLECQLLILALGFDPWSFTKFLTDPLRLLLKESSVREHIVENIGHDLSITHPDVTAKLYVPMLAGFSQGPGFPNLSCLGTLSDRILNRAHR